MKQKELLSHRPRRFQPAGLGWLIVVIVLIVGACGVVHVQTRNKIHALGRQQSEVEREIAALEQEIRGLEMRVEESLSRKNLTDRLAAQRTQLRAITPETLVSMPPSPAP